MNVHNTTLTLALVASFLASANAVAAETAADPAPTDTSLPEPATTYRSAFSDYQPQQELTLQSWRAVNDEVGKIGGHVGHIKHDAPAPGPAESSGEGKQ